VQVSLGDVGDADAEAAGQGQDAVDVPLRVDHDRDLPVVGQVAAVAQG
jgi:hypothetical protein